MRETKIIQIIPADGWVAIYNDNNDINEDNVKDDVVCFALVEITEIIEHSKGEPYQEIIPMINGEFKIELCDEASNYAGVKKINGFSTI